MNFTLRFVGFPNHEIRLKGIQRREYAANVINYAVRSLADMHNAGEPDQADPSDEVETFWRKISERPVFIFDQDSTAVVRDVSDDLMSVAEAFKELDTGVVAGEVGWIGFKGVRESVLMAGSEIRTQIRDLFLCKAADIKLALAPQFDEPVDTFELCTTDGRVLEPSQLMYSFVEDDGTIRLKFRFEPRIHVLQVSLMTSSDVLARRRRLPRTNRAEVIEMFEVSSKMSLYSLQRKLGTDFAVAGPGFVDWDAANDSLTNIALLHPETELIDLTGSENVSTLRLSFVIAEEVLRPARDTQPPVARVKIVRKSATVDVNLLATPYRAAELLKVLADEGYLAAPSSAVLYFGHDVVDHREDLWSFVPRGHAPIVLLTVDE